MLNKKNFLEGIKMENWKAYDKIYNRVLALQGDLMNIDDYSEEVYQAFEKLLDELESTKDELEHDLYEEEEA